MPTLQEVFQRFAPEYLRRFGDRMPGEHKKVIRAILACRTDHYGKASYACDACGEFHYLPRGCGNRHCPTCQQAKTRDWLQRQLDRRLPCPHFLITFTIPEAARKIFRHHQAKAYNALFAASADTLKAFAADPRHVGGSLAGFWGILHTWGRQLQYHPHIHYVVPGGALSADRSVWHPVRCQAYFAPIKAMTVVFRAKLRDHLKADGLLDAFPRAIWKTGWNINCQFAGSGEQTVAYLSRYVFKVAITDARIRKISDGQVTFQYTPQKSDTPKLMTLDGLEFLRRFLQHVLPTGFQKIRYYGFYGAAAKIDWKELGDLVSLTCNLPPSPLLLELPPRRQIRCPSCGSPLRYIASSIRTRKGPIPMMAAKRKVSAMLNTG